MRAPAVFRASGGHPELVGDAGWRSTSPRRCPRPSTGWSRELDERRAAIQVAPLAEVADRYLEVLRRERATALLARPSRAVARGFVRARTRALAAALASLRGRRAQRLVGRRGRAPLEATARRLGYEVAPSGWASLRERPVGLPHQPLRGAATTLARVDAPARDGVPARPAGDGGLSGVRPCVRGSPRACPTRFSRIQVTHEEMRDLVLEAGVEPECVHLIPIGIDLENFPLVTPSVAVRRARGARPCPTTRSSSARSRRTASAGERASSRSSSRGRTCSSRRFERAQTAIPELRVLLTGPARGYVRRELERAGIPYGTPSRGVAPSWQPRTTPSTRTSSPLARREGRRPCSSRWPPAFRSSRPASGRHGARRGRCERLARGRGGRGRSRRACDRDPRGSNGSRPRERARHGRAVRPRAARPALGESSSTASWSAQTDEPPPTARARRARCRPACPAAPVQDPHADLGVAAAVAALALGSTRRPRQAPRREGAPGHVRRRLP